MLKDGRNVDGKGAQAAAVVTTQAEKDTQLVEGIREVEVVSFMREDSNGHGRETGYCHRVMVTIMLRAVVLRTKNVFIVSAVNCRYEQKNLPK